ncbi:metastasis-associated in colon cancer protein 1 [Cololabis saira]|uniref:metastasis-associated in colon cancer protein 1 n=1 Tax=Cololabis saira TaxID=129043 RepID=UPI002AD465B7|nr:metastasis-associated in colon cancer protein 1 [Cololabis saira]XP_061572631.1 metastasis-associated in colon cancer protein 1 [Cololabis saira]
MAAGGTKSFNRVGSLMRSRSEGTLIDLSDTVSNSDHLNGGYVSGRTQNSEWQLLQPESSLSSQIKNPFWNKLSGSNPFLDDIVHSSNDRRASDTSSVKQETKIHPNTSNDDAISTSSDEGNMGHFLENKHKTSNRSGRWRSASDILDDLERKVPKCENSVKPLGPVLNPDFEWLKNDREAYKMAWLSHRQLTRSCVDLNLMSQSPGWAQTQATNFHVICKIGHNGGSIQLPESKISIHVPQGHVPPAEVQEVTLKAMLDPPPGLNNNYMTTMSPLLEVLLSNINTKECLSVEMKLSGEVKDDPSSQVMTTVFGLVSNKREGPYVKMNDCYIYKNMMQMKLRDLKTHFYIIAVAEASALQAPATSVWDYLDRQITIAVYGPRYIHPSFKVVIVVCCHEDVPSKLPFSDICRGNKQLPPLVLQLWGKHCYKLDKLNDFHVGVDIAGSVFKIKPEDKVKQVRQSQLKIGTVRHLPVALSCTGDAEMSPFKLDVHVKDANMSLAVAHFQISSPPAAPIRSEKRMPRQAEKRSEMVKTPEGRDPEFPSFKDKPVNLQWYGVALKSVLRQPRVEYLLEYFKGDTVALLSKETVRSVGNSKVKEWHIGFLRGRTGLIHCKNIKLITKDQVIDFTGIQISTAALLNNMSLPFKKLTYMYSGIQTLVTEHITSWRSFADALGYRNQPLDTITRRDAESEDDKVACVLERLKEDCHTDKTRRKFLHELMVGLLKMDSVNIVAQLITNTVILSTAVELGVRWRELGEKMGRLSAAQIAAYEAPHRGKNGEVNFQSMWKPAYDFLYSWSQRYGDGYRDMIQDLHLVLDKMKNPATRQWRHLTGALITVNCLDIFRDSAFPKP